MCHSFELYACNISKCVLRRGKRSIKICSSEKWGASPAKFNCKTPTDRSAVAKQRENFQRQPVGTENPLFFDNPTSLPGSRRAERSPAALQTTLGGCEAVRAQQCALHAGPKSLPCCSRLPHAVSIAHQPCHGLHVRRADSLAVDYPQTSQSTPSSPPPAPQHCDQQLALSHAATIIR